MDVLQHGEYTRLPLCIKASLPSPLPNGALGHSWIALLPLVQEFATPTVTASLEETLPAYTWLNHQLRLRLCTCRLPADLSSLRVAHGRVLLRAEGLFELAVTLSGPDPGAPWRLLRVSVQVEKPGEEGVREAESAPSLAERRLLTEGQVVALHQLLAARLESPAIKDKLTDLASVTRCFCVHLQLSLLAEQANQLAQRRWGRTVQVQSGPQSLQLKFWG
jgi:hypothetical protein